MSASEALKYTREHEWVSHDSEQNVLTVGITEYAASELGDVVFVQLPQVGDSVSAGQVCGEIESTKSVSELFAPVSGTVQAVNDTVVETPEEVNNDPLGTGWLMRITPAEGALEQADLLDSASYETLTGGASA